ncbi:hypothetical protein FSP39_002547 [Pinctada imbricata]|uniref:Uncharacterized protein n=1 Tax=Pinctada imbricata TaxID=66713 RepID=A0AA88YA18_PINIB|nr:hypothetical protein FSP39_002547 [Pinctada imbricata]
MKRHLRQVHQVEFPYSISVQNPAHSGLSHAPTPAALNHGPSTLPPTPSAPTPVRYAPISAPSALAPAPAPFAPIPAPSALAPAPSAPTPAPVPFAPTPAPSALAPAPSVLTPAPTPTPSPFALAPAPFAPTPAPSALAPTALAPSVLTPAPSAPTPAPSAPFAPTPSALAHIPCAQFLGFEHPFTMLVAGPTMSGKTNWLTHLLKLNKVMIKPAPTRILWIYKRWQPIYDVIKSSVYPPVTFIQGLPKNLQQDNFIDPRDINLVIIDDLQKDASSSQDVCELFTEGAHHRNLSVICIMQNIFYKGRENRTMSLNSQYLVFFKNPRDQQQIAILASQMYPGNASKLLDAYRQAIERPYGYLVVDLKQNTPELYRLQTYIFRNYIKEDTHEFDHSLTSIHAVNTSNMSSRRGIEHERQTTRDSGMETDPKYPSCTDCGVMFENQYDVQRHVRRGCPMYENSEEEMDTDGEDDDEGYDFLINSVWKDHNKEFYKRVNELLKEKSLTEKEAKSEASKYMLPKDKKLFMKKYQRFLFRTIQLKSSKLHRKIVNQILEASKRKSVDKAVEAVVKNHKKDYDELFDESENESNENSDSEESDETE